MFRTGLFVPLQMMRLMSSKKQFDEPQDGGSDRATEPNSRRPGGEASGCDTVLTLLYD
jgi:hypothetical protein